MLTSLVFFRDIHNDSSVQDNVSTPAFRVSFHSLPPSLVYSSPLLLPNSILSSLHSLSHTSFLSPPLTILSHFPVLLPSWLSQSQPFFHSHLSHSHIISFFPSPSHTPFFPPLLLLHTLLHFPSLFHSIPSFFLTHSLPSLPYILSYFTPSLFHRLHPLPSRLSHIHSFLPTSLSHTHSFLSPLCFVMQPSSSLSPFHFTHSLLLPFLHSLSHSLSLTHTSSLLSRWLSREVLPLAFTLPKSSVPFL